MNKEEIDKWLNNEYGVSYTSLEKIHDCLVDENRKKDKEIERLNNTIKHQQEENERLKEDITTMNNHIDKIQKENNILKENAEHNDKVVDKAKWNEMIYKSRCEKAISFINGDYLKENEYCFAEDFDFNKLLNILQGNDKE